MGPFVKRAAAVVLTVQLMFGSIGFAKEVYGPQLHDA